MQPEASGLGDNYHAQAVELRRYPRYLPTLSNEVRHRRKAWRGARNQRHEGCRCNECPRGWCLRFDNRSGSESVRAGTDGNSRKPRVGERTARRIDAEIHNARKPYHPIRWRTRFDTESYRHPRMDEHRFTRFRTLVDYLIDGINTRTQNIAEYETVTSQSAVARRDRFPGEIGYANATRLRRSIFYEIDERTGINGRARAGCLRYNSLHPVRQHDKSVTANTKTNLLKPPTRSFPRQLRYRGHSYLRGRRRDCEIYRVVPVRRLAFRWRLMHDSFLGAAPGEKGHVSLSEA